MDFVKGKEQKNDYKNNDFLALNFCRDEFTDYQILKITYDKDEMKTYGTRDLR